MSDSPRVAVVGVPGAWSSEALADAFAARTGHRILVDLGAVALDLAEGRLLAGDIDLCRCDAIVLKKAGATYDPNLLDRLELLRFASACGVPVFSRPEAVIRLIDRLGCTTALRGAGLPMPDTVVTEDLDAAEEAVRRFGRAVLKPLYSTKARGMTLVDATDDVAAVLQRFQQAGNPMIYVQQRLELSRDLGVVFIGSGYAGTYARVKQGDAWNTTIRAGGRYAPFTPSAEVLDIARRARDLFDLAFTSVDVVETEQGPMVFEVSAFGGFRGLHDGLGIDAAARYADWVLGALGAPARPVAVQVSTGDGVGPLIDRLSAAHPPTRGLGLRVGDLALRVETNAEALHARLQRYFRPFVRPVDRPDLRLLALEMPAPDFGLPMTHWQREAGKKGYKESFSDLADGRLVRKERTGMQFLLGRERKAAVGPCTRYDNQVINFICAQVMNHRLHQGYVLAHAAGIAHGGHGIAIAATSGAGKSTLMLHLMRRRGVRYVSNDRVLLRRDEAGVRMAGIPKAPRINPGTALMNPRLYDVLTPDRRRALAALPTEALWTIEEKYDVDITDCFGPDRVQVEAPLRAFFVLLWDPASDEPVRFTRTTFRESPHLLEPVMKSAGPFYEPPDGTPPRGKPPVEEPAYLEHLGNAEVWAVEGGVDFEAAVERCLSRC